MRRCCRCRIVEQVWNPATSSAALTAAEKAASGLDDWNGSNMVALAPLVYDAVTRRRPHTFVCGRTTCGWLAGRAVFHSRGVGCGCL